MADMKELEGVINEATWSIAISIAVFFLMMCIFLKGIKNDIESLKNIIEKQNENPK